MLTVLIGLPGSGKTTFASQVPEALVVSSDAVAHNWRRWFFEIARGLAEGRHVIADSTGFNAERRAKLLSIAAVYNVQVEALVFSNYAEAWRRNKESTDPIPQEAMVGMIKHFCDTIRELHYEGFDEISYRT